MNGCDWIETGPSAADCPILVLTAAGMPEGLRVKLTLTRSWLLVAISAVRSGAVPPDRTPSGECPPGWPTPTKAIDWRQSPARCWPQNPGVSRHHLRLRLDLPWCPRPL